MGRKRNGTAFPVDGGFTIQITTKEGKRPKKTLPTTHEGKPVTLAVARKLAQKCQTFYDAGLPVELFGLNQEKPKEAPTILEYLRKWHQEQTYPSVGYELSLIKLHIEPAKIAQIRMGHATKSDVREWVGWLKQQHPSANPNLTLAPKYIHKIYNLLSRACAAGAEFDDYKNPFAELSPRKLLPAAIERDRGKEKTYSRSNVLALLFSPLLPFERRLLYAVYFLTGLRGNEALATRFKNYDASKAPLGRLTIARALRNNKEANTKTKAKRLIPVHPVLATMLAEWKSSGFKACYGRDPLPDDFILPGLEFGPQQYHAVYRTLIKDCLLLGIAPNGLHTSRHTFISMALDDGADKDTLKRITHTAPRADAFDLYNHANWERLCRAMMALKIEAPEKEQKTMESALNIAPFKEIIGQVAENTNTFFGLKRVHYSTGNSYPSLSVDKRLLASLSIVPTSTQSNEQLPNNAPQRAINLPIGTYTGEALIYSFLELAELQEMGAL